MAEVQRKFPQHADPDNSGQCIHCGYILHVLDEDDEQHNRDLEESGKACGSESNQEARSDG